MLWEEMNQLKALKAALRVFLHLTKAVCAVCQLNRQGRGAGLAIGILAMLQENF